VSESEAKYLEHHQIVPILVGLMTGLFLAALDQTIVATSIRTIGDHLQGLSLQAWVTTAYLITSTIATPIYGKLGDIFGRKPLFIWAISIFVAGSLLCSLASSMEMLAGFRAVQGIGAGGLFTLALAIIGDIVPPRERARYQGFFIAVFGTSSVIGPVVGGFFSGQDTVLGLDGWRWIFFVNVPLGALALFLVNRTLKISHLERVDHRIDWFGAITLSTAVIPLLLVAERGLQWGWTSGYAILCYCVSIIGLLLFTRIELRMGDEAIIPLRLFKDKTFSIMTIVGIISGMAMFGGLAILPLFLQIVNGATPAEAGIQLLPVTLGIMVGSIVSGQSISRTGRYKLLPVFGSILITISLAWMTQLEVDTPYVTIALMSVLFGFGLGGLLQPTIIAVQNAVSPRDIGVATSSVTLFRQMGATLGTAVFLGMLFGSLPKNVGDSFAKAQQDPTFVAAFSDPANADTVAKLQQIQGAGTSAFDDTSWLATANQILIRPVLEGFASSMVAVVAIGALVALVAIFFTLFIPNNEVKGRSEAARVPIE
jgi:EmrB/QacA subfamily drug resistance transporter